MSGQNTPGPWFVAPDRFQGRLTICNANTTIAYMAVGEGEADDAQAVIAAPVLIDAILAVVAATRAYLPPDGIDAQECLNRILAATDNPTINPIILEAENGRD